MATCYICSNYFENFNDFWHHCSSKHRLNCFSVLTCVDCSNKPKFGNSIKFREHCEKIHNNRVVSKNCETSPCDKSHEENSSKSNTNFGDIDKRILKLISELYGRANFSRDDVQFVMEKIIDFSKTTANVILDTSDVSDKSDGKEVIIHCKSKSRRLNTLWDYYDTEHKRLKALDNDNVLFLPKPVTVHKDDEKEFTVQLFPLEKMLKAFFEIPMMYEKTMDYVNFLKEDSDVISNFVQGSLWQKKLKYFAEKDGPTLPLLGFYDDCEFRDGYGSHAGDNQMGAVYLTVPCLPPEIQASLRSILNAMLFHTKYVKVLNYNIIFKPFVQKLQRLQTHGIELNLPRGKVKLYFALGSMLGDNKGLNALLGFVSSFVGNFCCRLCVMGRDERRFCGVENKELLRNKQNYDEDVKTNNFSKTGIKFESVFNQLEYYHVTDNKVSDIMHDEYEGVCAVSMTHIVKHYTEGNKARNIEPAFSLDELNDRIAKFKFHPSLNRPPKISKERLADPGSVNIKMSSAEMWTFVMHFGVLVGDLIPNKKADDVWQYYLSLREIVSLTSAPAIPKVLLPCLEEMNKSHNETFVQLFSQNLKFKPHVLTHAKTVIESSGPFKGLWCMRMESQNFEVKKSSSSSKNTRNLPHTAAIRQQLKATDFFVSNSVFENTLTTGPISSVKFEELNIKLKDFSMLNLMFNVTSHATKFGVLYKIGMYVCVGSSFQNSLQFAKIVKIVVEGDDISFILQNITAKMNVDYGAFEILSVPPGVCYLLRYKDLFTYSSFIACENSEGTPFIVLQNDII